MGNTGPGEETVASAAPGMSNLAILSLAGFASTLSMRFFDPMIVVVARDLAVDPARIALLASAFALPYALVQPILGPIGDALGKERVMTVCLASLALALMGCALAPNDGALFCFRILSGASAGGVIPLALATIGDRVAMADRQVAISRFLVFSISGQLVGGTMAGFFSQIVNWRGVVGVAAAIALAAFLGFFFGLRGRPKATGRFTFGTAVERYGRILALGRARALFAFVFVEAIVIFGIHPFVAPTLEERGQGGPFEAGLILGAFAVGGITYTFIVRWLLLTLGLRRMLIIAGFVLAAMFTAIGTGPAWYLQAGFFGIAGCAFYMLHNSYQTQVTELVSDARGSAVSLHAFSFFCGQALGPILVGASLANLGFLRTAEMCGLGALALGCASALILFPRQPRPL